jgi:hypothetical protein
MDRTYLVHFDNGDSVDITPGELDGISHNLSLPGAANFQWIKRTEGFLVIAIDKVTSIEPKKIAVDAVVTPPSPDTIRRDKEKQRVDSISSKDAVLGKLKAKDEENK